MMYDVGLNYRSSMFIHTHTHALDLPAYEEQAVCVSIETFDHPSLLIGCAQGGGAPAQ